MGQLLFTRCGQRTDIHILYKLDVKSANCKTTIKSKPYKKATIRNLISVSYLIQLLSLGSIYENSYMLESAFLHLWVHPDDRLEGLKKIGRIFAGNVS